MDNLEASVEILKIVVSHKSLEPSTLSEKTSKILETFREIYKQVSDTVVQVNLIKGDVSLTRQTVPEKLTDIESEASLNLDPELITKLVFFITASSSGGSAEIFNLASKSDQGGTFASGGEGSGGEGDSPYKEGSQNPGGKGGSQNEGGKGSQNPGGKGKLIDN
jgi:hypothetical protein